MKTPPVITVVLCIVGAAVAQPTAFHTFTAPPSDVAWPAQIIDSETLYPYDEISPGLDYEGFITVGNDINNTIFFDDNYLAAGNAPNISGNAMWGNPRSGAPLGIPFLTFDLNYFFSEDENSDLVEKVTSISFELAWASSNPSADLGTISLQVNDYDGNSEFISVDLNQTFTHSLGGNGEGYSGRVVITAGSDVALDNIGTIFLNNISQLNPGGFVGELAIDDIRINGADNNLSEVYPVDFQGQPQNGYGTNSLKGQGIFGIGNDVYNGLGDATTFSVYWSGSDPAIYQPYPYVNYPIDPGETVNGAVEWAIDTDTALSGTYSGEFTIVNDGNPTDPDDIFSIYSYKLYDPPVLGGNAGATITLPGGNQATITNADVETHEGALRASVRITETVLTNPRFSVTGMAAANIVDNVVQNPAVSLVEPGGSLSGSFTFNSAGASSGTHIGVFRTKLEMTTPSGYLNDKESVPDRVWSLSYIVAPKPTASPAVTNGQAFAEAGADISGPDTGAALIGGSSSSDQTVNLSFDASPPVSNPSGYGSAINLSFSSTQQLYVLQLSYNDLPLGYAEQDLRIQALNSSTWVPAISLNGNGGTPVAGAQPYAGSYAAYLSELGGNTLDTADLGAYGVDVASNTAWIVLDYEGTFQLITGTFTAPFKILSINYAVGTNTTTISYQSLVGSTHNVIGGMSPGDTTPIGTTDVGTGAIMEFTHQPTGAPSRYFYRMSEP